MKKLLLLLVLAVALGGCRTQAEINDDIIKETKKCVDAGLAPMAMVNGGGAIGYVQCEPLKPDSQLKQ